MIAFYIIAAVTLDLMFGDPRNLPHPVVIIGNVIARGEKLIRRTVKSITGLKLAGIVLVLLVVAGTYFIVDILLIIAESIHPHLEIALQILLIYTAISIRSLQQHAREVASPLKKGDLARAREKLSLIVGRDTDRLSEKEIIRGVVETVAENTVDGIISPLFFAFIGGAPLALAYKAVNTLDSMIGYKDERFYHLGWAAARLDDLANYLPARIAGFLFLIAAVFSPRGPATTLKIIRRDAKKHPSPNSGIPEAAVAGALGIKLGGLNYYFGKPSYRQEMGDKIFELQLQHIDKSIMLMYAVSFLMVLGGTIIYFAFS